MGWHGIGPWADAQTRLGRLHDEFTAVYGPINKVVIRNLPPGEDGEERISRSYPNLRPFRSDPDFVFVSALEIYDEATFTARKADLFHRRVLSPERSVKSAASVADALAVCLDEKGRIDADRIAELVSTAPDAAVAELLGRKLVYRDPKSQELQTADEYLSGNVRRKLRQAEAAVRKDPAYRTNLDELKAVQPADLVPGQIEAVLGAPWIPTTDVRYFLEDTLGLTGLEVAHVRSEGSWSIQANKYGRGSVACTAEWGTKRKDALSIAVDALNQRLPEVWDTDDDGKRTKNFGETLNAREKLEKMQQRFSTWLWEDEGRAIRLCRRYNDLYNNSRLRTYDGSHLTLPGSSEAIGLRKHQLDAVWRIMQGDNCLLAHAVGAGKTFTAIAAAMEMRRTGLANKPLITVPNHMLEQFSREFVQLYPDARLLVADKDDLTGDGRRRFVAKVATSDVDAVIMTHSGFGRIAVGDEWEERFVREEMEELRRTLEQAKTDGEGSLTVKNIEKALKRKEERLGAKMNTEVKDKSADFSMIGCDYLFVDEAHLFKNLDFTTKMQGIGVAGSQRSTDLHMKIRYLESLGRTKCATFLTGTPISNSIAEMFTMQRYLQPKALREKGISHFDSWAANYGRMVSQLELSPDGASYRVNTRFARFCNVPELVMTFREVADVQTADMLKLPTPELKGGKARVVTVPPSPELKAFIADLAKRAEVVKSRMTDPSVDNMLKICTDGRKAALDMRLVGEDAEIVNTKIAAAVGEIMRIYHENEQHEYLKADGTRHPVRGSLQLVFCDTSAPSSNRWNAYDAVRDGLIAAGMPGGMIRYIHEADTDERKARLFHQCREGGVSVLVGSTPKMGCGTNVQTRLAASHNLDAPYRPSDLEQRDGRILRQGCQHRQVEILRYVTEQSFDSFMWGMLERKAGFIGQVTSGKLDARTVEDVDMPALSYAEVKALATGDPRIMEKAAVDNEVARLTRLKSSYDETVWRLRGIRHSTSKEVETLEADLLNLDHSIRQVRDTRGDQFSARVGRSDYHERKSAGEAIIAAAKTEVAKGLSLNSKGFQSVAIGSIGGFGILCETGGKVGKGRAEIVLAAPYRQSIGCIDLQEEADPLGTVRQLEHRLRSFELVRKTAEENLAHARTQIAQAERQLGVQWEHDAKLVAALARQREIDDLLHPTATAAPEAQLVSAKLDQQAEVHAAAASDILPCPHSRTASASTIPVGHSTAARPRRSAAMAF